MSSIYHWDGTEWTKVFTDYSVWFQDIYFTAPDDGWAVAHESYDGSPHQYRWDGTEWNRIDDGIFDGVQGDAVHFVDSDWGWIIGSPSTFFYDGNQWTEYLPYGGASMDDIYCISKNDVWISAYPNFLHFTGFNK